MKLNLAWEKKPVVNLLDKNKTKVETQCKNK